MKVLHVIPSLSAAHGGPTQALLMMERALAQAGVHVETATTDDDGPGRRIARPLGVPVDEGPARRWYFARSIEFYKVAPGFVPWILREARRFDVIHIHSLFSFTTPAAAWAARRAKVPYVVRPLGTLDAYGLRNRRPCLKAASTRFIERPLLRHAAAVHFTSEAEAAQAGRLGWAMRGVVIPLAVEAAASGTPRDFPAKGLRVLFLSRLDPKKNLESLLQAAAVLREEIPGLHVTIAGDGDAAYVAALKRQAEELGVSGVVRWLGHVEGEAKQAAWRDADVFILPSFSENFGVAAAEALATGLPCIVGEGVALGADIESAGAGLRTRAAPEAVAAALRSFAARRSEWAQMSLRANEMSRERYSPASMGRALARLYADILAR